MTLDALKEAVLNANLATAREGLVSATFGNVSGIDQAAGRVVIKPSGVPYESLRPDDMVVTDLDGRVVEGNLKPSSDLATHLALYRACDRIGGIVHTHSPYATIFAQTRKVILPLGTTHADYFFGPIPVTRDLTVEEIEADYVGSTGAVIIEAFNRTDPLEVPAALVAGHGPFAWGVTPADAVGNALMLEEVARLAWHTLALDPAAPTISQVLLDRHYRRKHGVDASYGQ